MQVHTPACPRACPPCPAAGRVAHVLLRRVRRAARPLTAAAPSVALSDAVHPLPWRLLGPGGEAFTGCPDGAWQGQGARYQAPSDEQQHALPATLGLEQQQQQQQQQGQQQQHFELLPQAPQPNPAQHGSRKMASSSRGSSSSSNSSSSALQEHFCSNCTRPVASAVAVCASCGHSHTPDVPATEGSSPTPSAASYQSGGGIPHSGSTMLAYDARMLAHCEPPQLGMAEHVERPARVTAIMDRLQATGVLQRCLQVDGKEATVGMLEAVHDADLVWLIRSASSFAKHRVRKAQQRLGEGAQPSPYSEDDYGEIRHMISRYIRDVPVNEHSFASARVAAGTAARVAVAVARGEVKNGAAIVRPPGHHAESALAMGFCHFNNAAIAAKAAQQAGAQRVLIMDWDIHHGNGTQNIFLGDKDVMYQSVHRYDGGSFFPGTGSPSRVGVGHGEGYNMNCGWDGPGVQDGDYMAVFRHLVIPIAKEFAPDLVIISAGFDAAEGDPLGGCKVTPQAFGHMCQMLCEVGPTVLLLEGGYNLSATAECTHQCMRVLLGDAPPVLQPQLSWSMQGRAACLEALAAQAPFWAAARRELDALSHSSTRAAAV